MNYVGVYEIEDVGSVEISEEISCGGTLLTSEGKYQGRFKFQ